MYSANVYYIDCSQVSETNRGMEYFNILSCASFDYYWTHAHTSLFISQFLLQTLPWFSTLNLTRGLLCQSPGSPTLLPNSYTQVSYGNPPFCIMILQYYNMNSGSISLYQSSSSFMLNLVLVDSVPNIYRSYNIL